MTVQAQVAPTSAVVCNPAKVQDAEQLRAEVERLVTEAGWPRPAWFETTTDDPGLGQAKEALAAGARVVFACGGDGTVRACVTALTDTDAALAVIPAGTGNLLARHLGIPLEAGAAVRIATHGERRRIDIGDVEGDFFTVAAGIGFDADLLASAPEGLKRTVGWPAYAVSALRHLRDRRFRVELRLDGGAPRSLRVRSVIVANVGELRGGLTLAPAAADDDGVFDVVVISPKRLREWVTAAYHVLRRRHHDRITTFTAAAVDVRVQRGTVARQLDGDSLTPGNRLTVRVRPAAVEVCVPTTAAEPASTRCC